MDAELILWSALTIQFFSSIQYLVSASWITDQEEHNKEKKKNNVLSPSEVTHQTVLYL